MTGKPRCPECQRPLTYDVAYNRWNCAVHGPQWTGEALAQSLGYRDGGS